MCGIAGIVAPRGVRLDLETLQPMLSAIRHRGPDGDGAWLAPEGHVAFGHRRLSIIDLSEAAAQPMLDPARRVCVTYNGEIYNHTELRRDLERMGRPFATNHADTEVLLQGYLTWGIDELLRRLNGIFAFALHDRERQRTILVRDPVGIKPLYFAWRDSHLVFASGIKALQTGRAGSRINAAAAFHYLTFMVAPAPLTMFEGVYKLPAGHMLSIDAEGGASVQRYFAPWPDSALDTISAADQVEAVRDAVRASVRRQLLAADVPVGIFLSSGVDSTALLAIATEINGTPLRTFSVGFTEATDLDETVAAAGIAQRFGAHHVEVRIGAPSDETLEELVREQDEPLADWVCLPLRAVAKSAHEAGLKTVLCGEGADEQFCGYDHYLRYLAIAAGPHKWLSGLHRVGLGAPVTALADAFGGRDLRRSFHADFVRRAALGQEAFWGGAIVFSDGMKRIIWRGQTAPQFSDSRLDEAGLASAAFRAASGDVVTHMMAPLNEHAPNAEALQRMVWLEFAHRLPELLLMRVDKMCMASSLEARVPFLDLEIVRLAARFAQDVKIPEKRPKALLKAALRGIVPDDVLDRPKRGFGAPMRDWLRGPFGDAVHRRLSQSAIYEALPLDKAGCLRLLDLHRAGGRDYSVYIWTLANLVWWFDHWIAGGRSS